MPTYSPARLAGVAVTARSDTRQHRSRVLDHGFVRLDDAMAERPLGRQRRAGQLRPAQGRAGRVRRGPDPLPDARAARDAVRAQRLPLPRPLPDLRRARVVPAPGRLVQRVQPCATRRRPTTSTCPSPRTCAARSASRARTRSSRSPDELAETDARAAAGRLRAGLSRPTSSSVELGVARELARSVLPVGAYTEFYWTVNARSLMNFVSLRNAETAQREIRRYAEAVRAVPRRADAGHVRGASSRTTGPRPRSVAARPGACALPASRASRSSR